MIEILNIFYLLLISALIFSFPLNNLFFKKKLLLSKLNFFEICSLNILFILTFFLILSFFEINIRIIFLVFLSLSILNFFYFDWKILIKNLYLLIFFTIFFVVFSTEISTYPYLEWDAAVNWIFKTLNFKNDYSFQNLENVYGYKGYPHIGPYLWAFFWDLSLVDHEYTGRLSFIFIYLIIFFSLVDRLKINNFSKIIILLFLIFISYDRIILNGYQEPLMFSLCVIFMIIIEKINNSKDNFHNYLFLIICANLILWIKNEGVFFLFFLSFFILFKKEIEKKYKYILLTFFIFLFFIKKIIFIHHFGNVIMGWEGYEFLPVADLFSIEIMKRLPYLIFQILMNFIKYPIYIVFFICLLITLFKEKKLINSLDFIFFLLINLLMVTSIYYMVNDPSWMFHAKVALDRLLYQTSGVYLIYILRFFEKNISKKVLD